MQKFLLFAAAALVAAGASAETKNVIAEMYPGSAGLIGWGGDATREVVTEDGRECLKVTNPTAGDFWSVQIAFDTDFKAGTTYYFTFDVKGDAGSITSGFQQIDGYIGCGNFDNFDITASWNTVTIKGTATTSENGDPNRWVANIGDYVGTFYISNMSLYTLGQGETPVDPEPGDKTWVSLINGGVAADGQTPSIQAGWNGDAQVVANPAGEGVVFECPIAADPENPWDSQLFIVFNDALMAGDKYKVSFDYYCSDARTIGLQAQGNPGEYHNWTCGLNDLSAKPEWQSVSAEKTVDADMAGSDGFKTIAFNLASAAPAATFYINNVKVEKEATSVVETIAVKTVATGVYNMNGVKVLDNAEGLDLLPKGIYIVNGKKVVR